MKPHLGTTKHNLEAISEQLLECLPELLEHFDITCQDHGNRIMFACPIHEGDNETGSSIMRNGVGNWRCFTQQCHEPYGSANGAGVIQFVQALVSKRENREVSFYEAINWCAKFLGAELEVETESTEDHVRTKFIQLCKYINRTKVAHTPVFTPRSMLRSFLKIPAEYYVQRGYSEEILDKFDIGYCFNTNKSLFDRIITPFYDDNGEYMIGCTGRNKFERCERCRLFHQEDTRCPITKEEKLKAVKWKHSNNFSIESYLYNYHNAKSHILTTHSVILVEGPGDVWRLEEAGIHNSMALLGASLSKNQQIILEDSGAVNLLIATDNDDAGRKAAQSITQNCGGIFNIRRIVYPGKDPGGLTIEQAKQIFIPILERI
jgi:DNA primase